MNFRHLIIAAATVVSFSASAQTYKDELVQCAQIAKQVHKIRTAIDQQDLIQAVYLQDQFEHQAAQHNMQERYMNAVYTATTKRFASQDHLINFLMLECTH